MLKDMLKEWKMLLIIVICIGAVLWAININNGNTATSNTSANNTTANNKILNMSGDDENFTKWLGMSSRLVANDLDCISKAAKNQNFTDTEKCGKFLGEDSNRILNESNSHDNISIYLVPVMDQYKDALKNYSLGGENLEIGAKNQNATQIAMGTRYIEMAYRQGLRARHLYSSLGKDNSVTGVNNSG